MHEEHPRMVWIYWGIRDVGGARTLRHRVAGTKP